MSFFDPCDCLTQDDAKPWTHAEDEQILDMRRRKRKVVPGRVRGVWV